MQDLEKAEEVQSSDIKETKRDRTSHGEETCCFGLVVWDTMYVRKFWTGRLKLMQFASTLLAAALLPTVIDYYHARFIFFRFVGWCSFSFICVDLLINLTGIVSRLPRWMRSPDVSLMLTGLASFCFMVASSLTINIADVSGSHDRTLIASFFGFVSMVLFGIEAILHCMIARHQGAGMFEEENA